MKTHDNSRVKHFLKDFLSVSDACKVYWMDDIMSGVLELRKAKDTSTRSLKRTNLYTLVSRLDNISAQSIRNIYPHYSMNTCYGYAQLVRIVSKAVEMKLDTDVKALPMAVKESRLEVDKPYHDELRPYGLIEPFIASKQWKRPLDWEDTSEWAATCLPEGSRPVVMRDRVDNDEDFLT